MKPFLVVLAVLAAFVAGTVTAPSRWWERLASPAPVAASPAALQHFDEAIAPLLSRHCLECHDAVNRKGGIDLSRREPAFRGEDGVRPIIPGKPERSPVWQSVEAGDMPHQRDPMSEEEKGLLKDWIAAGAVWSGDIVDPIAHLRDRRAGQDWLRRLTVPEYIASVEMATGVGIGQEARERLPQDPRADGFTNTAYNLNVDLGHVEAYADLARTVADRVDAGAVAARFTGKGDAGFGAMRELIAGMGAWILRGPLEDREIDAYLAVVESVQAEQGDFGEAVRFLVEAMLQSPRFLYRMERQAGGDGGAEGVSPHELASRLSYLVWGAPPDERLSGAAASGTLSDAGEIAAQVDRMLADPRAVARSVAFIEDWLDLGRLGNLRPEPSRFPRWSRQLGLDMREETVAFFEEIVWKRTEPLVALLNAPVTFTTPALAAHYGLDPAQGRDPVTGEAEPEGFAVARRSGPDLVALYTFGEGSGTVIRDVSGREDPIDLHIGTPDAVQWNEGTLTVSGPAVITSKTPPQRLHDAIRDAGELTLEAWITPGKTPPPHLGRIVSLSSGPSQRDFTLGQERDGFEARLRGRNADGNGLPGLAAGKGSAAPGMAVHLALTSDPEGQVILYQDGKQVAERKNGRGFPKWDGSFLLVLADETSRDRSWTGTFHQIAIHRRALTADEIRARGSGTLRFDLGSGSPRRGLLTQGSVLTVGGDDASTVTRGLFVLRDLLDSGVTSAPPGTDTTPVPPEPGQSRRDVAQMRLENQSCAGCHAKFEPLAFAFEKYDGLGAFAETDEHGNRLREDGRIYFPGEREAVSYETTHEFLDILAGHERVKRNMTRKLVQFAIGRPPVPADNLAIEAIHRQAWEEGGTYAALIRAIALSPLVRGSSAEHHP